MIILMSADRPLAVSIDCFPQGKRYVATAIDLKIYCYGDSPARAIERVKKSVYFYYETLFREGLIEKMPPLIVFHML